MNRRIFNECETEGDDDICFYRSVDNKKNFISNDEETPVPVLKHNVGKQRIESDSESDSKVVIANCDETCHKIDENKIVIPEAMRQFYGTDNYEWNHYKLPKGEVCDFLRDESFLQNFLQSLRMSSGDKASLNPFLLMSKNYVGEKENNYDIVDDPLSNEEKQSLSKARIVFIQIFCVELDTLFLANIYTQKILATLMRIC